MDSVLLLKMHQGCRPWTCLLLQVIWNKTEYLETTIGLTPWSLLAAEGETLFLLNVVISALFQTMLAILAMPRDLS